MVPFDRYPGLEEPHSHGRPVLASPASAPPMAPLASPLRCARPQVITTTTPGCRFFGLCPAYAPLRSHSRPNNSNFIAFSARSTLSGSNSRFVPLQLTSRALSLYGARRWKGSTATSAAATSSAMTYERELTVAKKAAALAARLCQKVQKDISSSDIQSKSDKTPVTVADYGSQAVVSFVLGKEFGADNFSLVAEEDSEGLRNNESQEIIGRITALVNATLSSDDTYKDSLSQEDIIAAIDKGSSEGGPHGRHWVLDPIDGTKGFLRGDQYAVALGLLDQGKVVLGVLACPNLPSTSVADGNSQKDHIGCLFYAEVGAGTSMELLDGSPPVKVTVTTIENPTDASFFESFEAAHSQHDLSSSIAKKLGVQAPPVRIDSQAKYAALARGDGAIYLRFPHKGYREKIWDHAAGSIVVSEAGGVVTDAAGKPLDFSKGKHLDLDTGIIVTNQKLMPSLLKAVQDSIKESYQATSPL